MALTARADAYPGFPCPECGTATEVLHTESRLGWLYRRRQCLGLECRHRFSTHERPNFWLSRHEGAREER